MANDSSAHSSATGRGFSHGLDFAGLVLAFIMLVSVNILEQAGLSGARVDLTADSLYTLSPGTRSVLSKIDEPITLRFYYSTALGKELPALGKYAARVRDLVKEYAAIAGNKIKLEIIEPVPFSDAEDQAVAAGLQGLPLDRTGELVYFGLAGVNSTDDEERIPFFSPDREGFLEYDLTKLVYNLAHPKRKTIGLMSALPIRGYPGTMMARINPALAQPWQMIAHLQQLFDVRQVEMTAEEIPSDIDVLMIVHPAGMSKRTMYAIDRYVLNGGRALVFVDPLAEVAARMLGPGAKEIPSNSNLEPLLKAWGLTMDDEKAVGDMVAARRVNAGSESRPQPVEFPAWLALKKQNFSDKDQITANLEVMNMASAGALVAQPDATTTIQPLITSSDKSMLIPTEKLKGKPDFFGIVKDFKPTGEHYMLAARVSGPVKTAFPEGQPAESDEDKAAREKREKEAKAKAADEGVPYKPEPENTKPQLMESKGPIQAVVVSDADMLQDRFWVQLQNVFGQAIALPVSNNMDMVTNALDNLTGSNDLIGLRSRGVSQRPFERVVELQRNAEIRLRAKEQELQEQRDQTEKKLAELQRPSQAAGAQGGTAVLSPAQQQEIDKFKAELLRIRKDLRGVQLELRKDISKLQSWLWFFNIAAIPLLVALVAVGLSLLRIRRRKQRMLTEARG
jgi:ABC-type uncharacterized transport system involved in gliding motility auxiliary subunit